MNAPHRSRAGVQGAVYTLRCFVAFDLAPNVLTKIGELQRQLAATDADVRWVRPEGMHATLKFLGRVKTDCLPRLQSALTAAVCEQSALRLQVRGLGAFPNLRRPQVLWVGFVGSGLQELARSVDAVAMTLGFEAENRAFHGHVTLGRVNSLRGWPQLEALFKEHLNDDFGSTEVRSVVLYRSQLQAGGSVYSALWTIPLQQNKGGHHDD
ncbi:MAG TPA: RNA 2',3'-cyclic phosphodiesterase [Candidatus Acidoferrales bacterium]|nr:RNA 2',3'-cyclic phosphodiesterase [Candidatus Acidoferrales bacterium]